jgi:hypothetical protein
MNTGLVFADVQDALFEVMFQNELVLHSVTDWDLEGVESFLHNWDLSDNVVKAALVCKKWNQAFEDCLKRFCEREAAKLRQTAVVNGLALCGLARYEADAVSQLKQHTQEWHTVQVDFGDRFTLSIVSLTLTRWKADDAALHTLAVEYYPHKYLVGGKTPFFEFFKHNSFQTPDSATVRLVEIPQACFLADAELTQAQRGELAKWKQDFAEATALWLPTQRDAEGQQAALAAWRRDWRAWYQAWLKKLREDSP